LALLVADSILRILIEPLAPIALAGKVIVGPCIPAAAPVNAPGPVLTKGVGVPTAGCPVVYVELYTVPAVVEEKEHQYQPAVLPENMAFAGKYT
jgi:hypothetical protein